MDQNAEKNEKLESSYDENPYISKTYYHSCRIYSSYGL